MTRTAVNCKHYAQHGKHCWTFQDWIDPKREMVRVACVYCTKKQRVPNAELEETLNAS
jgi:hypothetical protein